MKAIWTKFENTLRNGTEIVPPSEIQDKPQIIFVSYDFSNLKFT